MIGVAQRPASIYSQLESSLMEAIEPVKASLDNDLIQRLLEHCRQEKFIETFKDLSELRASLIALEQCNEYVIKLKAIASAVKRLSMELFQTEFESDFSSCGSIFPLSVGPEPTGEPIYPEHLKQRDRNIILVGEIAASFSDGENLSDLLPVNPEMTMNHQTGDPHYHEDERLDHELLLASERGNALRAAELILAGAQLSARGYSWLTPLHFASALGHVDVVKVLLEAGAQPQLVSDEHETPLLMAARKGHPEIVQLLLDAGARPLRAGSLDAPKDSPLTEEEYIALKVKDPKKRARYVKVAEIIRKWREQSQKSSEDEPSLNELRHRIRKRRFFDERRLTDGDSALYYTPWRWSYRKAADAKAVQPQQAAPAQCALCSKINEGNGILPLNDQFIVMANDGPYALSGTLMILPRAHLPDVLALGHSLRLSLALALRRLSYVLINRLGFESFSIGINTGRVAGASIPEHLHVHAIPNRGHNLDNQHRGLNIDPHLPAAINYLRNRGPGNTLIREVRQKVETENKHAHKTFELAEPEINLTELRKCLDSSDDFEDGSDDFVEGHVENYSSTELRPTVPHCVFCNIVANRAADQRNLVIMRFKSCLVMFNPNPLVRGHMIIVPIEHQASPDWFAQEVIHEMLEVCAQMATLCTEELQNHGSMTGFNVGDRQAPGRSPEHMTMDFVPRWTGDISSLALSGTQIISMDMEKLREIFRDKLQNLVSQQELKPPPKNNLN